MTELYRPAWEGGRQSALRTLRALGTNETTWQGVVGGTASGTDWGLVKAAQNSAPLSSGAQRPPPNSAFVGPLCSSLRKCWRLLGSQATLFSYLRVSPSPGLWPAEVLVNLLFLEAPWCPLLVVTQGRAAHFPGGASS